MIFNVGEIITVRGRNEDLKRPDGTPFDYVLREDDTLYIVEVKEDSLICELREDKISKHKGRTFLYGLVVIPKHILNSEKSIQMTRDLTYKFDSKYNKFLI